MEEKKIKLLFSLLSELERTDYSEKPNRLNIKTTIVQPTENNAKFVNCLLGLIKEYCDGKVIKKTPSGGISYDRLLLPAYWWSVSNAGAELLFLSGYGFYKLQFRHIKVSDNDNYEKLRGYKAFKLFGEICKKYNINLDDYEIDNGLEIKETIEKPIIKVEEDVEIDTEYNNVNHLDFHNSYPSGLVLTHPEFKEPIEFLYKNRKENPQYKDVLNYSIGFMHSIQPLFKARLANLARDAINNNNERIRKLAEELKNSGRKILSYNTDGIWYQGELYHNETEGPDICQWHNDHVDCKFRIKSAGCYEYIENGEYHPVVRGTTKYDLVKPRTEWEWGDIYKSEAEVLRFSFTTEGIEVL